MRFFNVLLSVVLALFFVVVLVFYCRSFVVINIANHYLAEHDSYINSIDFTIDTDLNLVINTLHLSSPIADVDVLNSQVNWQLAPLKLANTSILELISDIQVNHINIQVKPQTEAVNHVNNDPLQQSLPLILASLPSFIHSHVNDFLDGLPEFSVNIDTIDYQLTNHPEQQGIGSYQGKVSLYNKHLAINIIDHTKAEILSLSVDRYQEQAIANIEFQLAEIQHLVMQHSVLFTNKTVHFLARELANVRGTVSSDIIVNEQAIVIDNQLINVKLVGGELINDIGITSVLAKLNWQTRIQADNLQLDFSRGDNQFTLETDTLDKMAELLGLVESLDENIKTLLLDNPIKNLQVDLSGVINIDLSEQKISGGTIYLSSQNLATPINLLANNIAFNYQQNPVFSLNLDYAELAFNSVLNIQQLHSISHEPISINLTTNIKQNSKNWLFTLQDDSSVSLQKLTIAIDEPGTEQYTKIPSGYSAKSLQFAIHGEITLDKYDLTNQRLNNVNVALALSGNAKQLNVNTLIQLNEVIINAQLNGSPDNIEMLAKISADELPIAEVEIGGMYMAPTLTIKGNDILLTDLLALNIQLPLEVNLIDGRLNYQVDGKILDKHNIMANTFNASITLNEVSGDIEGTWLQDLNWQQDVIIQNNYIKSIAKQPVLQGEVLPNLTLTKLESVTPITNLASHIVLDTPITAFVLMANDISGNLLGGTFELNQVQWPLSQIKPIELNLTEIDLEKLLALDKKQGIVVTGSISGHLPVYYNGKRPLIKEGHLYNVSSGVIQVFNNPAVEALKSENTQLKLAFDALQNLHYHHLSSQASMADDGYMLLLTTIKGQNPDLQNEVNFNLNLSYDLLGLLESLTITEQFENQVINGLQN